MRFRREVFFVTTCMNVSMHCILRPLQWTGSRAQTARGREEIISVERGFAMRSPPAPSRKVPSIVQGLVELDTFRTTTAVPDGGLGCRSWILSLAIRIRSRMRRVRESRRTRTALDALDDRMLKDVGIPRHEIVWVAGHDAAREIMRVRALASNRRRSRCDPTSPRDLPTSNHAASH